MLAASAVPALAASDWIVGRWACRTEQPDVGLITTIQDYRSDGTLRYDTALKLPDGRRLAGFGQGRWSLRDDILVTKLSTFAVTFPKTLTATQRAIVAKDRKRGFVNQISDVKRNRFSHRGGDGLSTSCRRQR